MSGKKGIHFEISERKVLLRVFDLLSVFVGLYLIGRWFEFDYFTITKEHWIWWVILAVYLTVFGTIFELYNLKQSSKLDTTFRNIILTASLTVLLYLLTPFAEQGNSEAQCILGNIYHLGLGVEVDIDKAIKWYIESAKQGYPIAENNLNTIAIVEGINVTYNI